MFWKHENMPSGDFLEINRTAALKHGEMLNKPGFKSRTARNSHVITIYTMFKLL